MYLYLDFETYDPYLHQDLGDGWTFKDIPNSEFKVIGCAYAEDDGPILWTENIDEILAICERHSILVAHNGFYDFGILSSYGLNLRNFRLHDTLLMAKLENNIRDSYSLDSLCKELFKTKKENEQLVDAVLGMTPFKDQIMQHTTWEFMAQEMDKCGIIERAKELFGKPFSGLRKADLRYKVYNRLNNVIKSNMHIAYEIAPHELISYAKNDVALLRQLHQHYKKLLNLKQVNYWGEILRICIGYRKQGVAFDINGAISLSQYMGAKIPEKLQAVYAYAGEEFNINSPVQKIQILQKLGITLTQKTTKGSLAVGKSVLSAIEHPIAAAIIEAMAWIKLKRDFVDKSLDFQYLYFGIDKSQALPSVGRLFPKINPLGAAATGRFSASNPNIQQVPARDKELGTLIRNLYIADEGEAFYSLDFSAQEPRMYVHFGHQFNIEGASELVAQFNRNPHTDLHQVVAHIADIDRTSAKTINLGLAYGMGIFRLAQSLKLTKSSAKLLLERYYQKMPFLRDLSKYLQMRIKQEGYVVTLSGRRLKRDKPVWINGEQVDSDYKALNKLSQGSSADQVAKVMYLADLVGLKVLFPVHDEIAASLRCKEEALLLAHLMRRAYTLHVPFVVDVGVGTSWGGAKGD